MIREIKPLRKLAEEVIATFQLALLNEYKDKKVVKIISENRNISKEMKPNEAYILVSCLKATKKVKGDIAEVGVYKGYSAKVISSIEKKKRVCLFDTFEGIPSVNDLDTNFKKGEYKASYYCVDKLFEKNENVFVFQGLFPQETGGFIDDLNFSFVHLDVDVYESTKDALKFFWNRMSNGGIILVHDYAQAKGVRKAVDEVKGMKVELTDTQVMLIKIREGEND